jgi:hypothetical protein
MSSFFELAQPMHKASAGFARKTKFITDCQDGSISWGAEKHAEITK